MRLRLRKLEYKWVALSNTTLGTLMAMINSSILLIALPNIFRGIGIDPLQPGNTSYLLWLLLGFLVVMAVLLVSLGRLGDMYGRVRMFRLGFAVFTFFSILLSVTWLHGGAGALWLIGMRVGQGVGAAMVFANSSAILTDAFPHDQRGLALGINSVSMVVGSFFGLVLGGLLAPVEWRLVFVISVPIGLFATIWSYHSLRELGVRKAGRIDWWGNLTFAAGLILLMVGITYGIQPYGADTMGWTSPLVLGCLLGGAGLLASSAGSSCTSTSRCSSSGSSGSARSRPATSPLCSRRWRAAASSSSSSSGCRGSGCPTHGYDFASTPLWAGIYMLPLILGLLIAGPTSGWLSDRFGARPFATGGMIVAATSFALLIALPVNFSYPEFALILLLNGIGMGLFQSPNTAAVMNSLPPSQRGAGAGMLATFNVSSSVLSIGVFFTLMIVGLAGGLPHTMQSGLVAHGVAPADATRISHLPPVATLFAAFLGYNPVKTLLGPHVLNGLSPANAHTLTGRAFFPHLISSPFHTALDYAFAFAIVACLVAAVASMLRGGKYVHVEEVAVDPLDIEVAA